MKNNALNIFSRRLWIVAILIVTLTGLPSCFTGVESTPKITAKDIKKKNATETPEDALLADIAGQRPATWQPGKRFYVTDDRIALIFMPGSGMDARQAAQSLVGHDIVLDNIGQVMSITGEAQVELTFVAPDGRKLGYRPGTTVEAFRTADSFEVPFTVERSLVDSVRSRLVGNTYYILTGRRIGADGFEHKAPRYSPVRILDVIPGNASQPLRVIFSENGAPEESLLMTVGRKHTATRNFQTLFAFDNPRKRYPTITDQIWELITASQVQVGMTSAECRLALGAPNDYRRVPSTGGMVEFWQYDNGTFLRFDDGRLSMFRL